MKVKKKKPSDYIAQLHTFVAVHFTPLVTGHDACIDKLQR